MYKNYSLLRPDLSMWRKALRGIPRVKDKAHWALSNKSSKLEAGWKTEDIVKSEKKSTVQVR